MDRAYKERSEASKQRHAEWREKHLRYAIRYQWRRPDGCAPGANPMNWRSWREFASVPILFKSQEAAEFYLKGLGDSFKNLRHHRKISCSIGAVYIAAEEKVNG